jgi:cellobiose transport system permease protein
VVLIETNTSTTVNPSPRRRRLSESKKNSISAYIYIAPFFILYSIFGVYPMVYSFYLAFFKWNGFKTSAMEFIGFQNFIWIFTDPIFWKTIVNTLLFGLIGTAPQLVLGVLLAFALNSALIRFKHIFRVAFFMPYVTSTVAVGLIFTIMFSPQDSGFVNGLLSYMGFDAVAWTTTFWGLKIAVSTAVFWRWLGYNTLIFLAGLQSIPNDLYEAAKIDGATTGQQIRFISIPLLKPTIIFTVFLSTIGALQLFAEPLMFIGRTFHPEGMTTTIYLWREAFFSSAFGTASASAIALFFLVLVLTLINVTIANRMGGKD